jgi:NAD(P)-dependent dehydrogenase (short-subunit alcohol dehydrogenase family)
VGGSPSGGGFYHATKHAVEAISDSLRFEVRGFGVEVVVIEPGLIRTSFAQTALASMEGGAQTSTNDPYAGFDAGVARTTRENYERGLLARLGGGPETVAETIELAIYHRAAAHPLRRHPLGEAVDLGPPAPAGSGLGRPSAPLLPSTRRIGEPTRDG